METHETSANDVRLIRRAESLHTRFVTELCFLIAIGFAYLFFWGELAPVLIIAFGQLILFIATFSRHQSWCQFRSRDDVKLAYQRHEELMRSLNQKAP